MLIHHKKNTAFELAIPMVDGASPASFKSGLTVADEAYYKDGAGAWTALAIADTFTEIGTTGLYEISLTAAEMNHDWVIIKCTAAGAADTFVTFRMFAVDTDDLVRATTPANTLNVDAGGLAAADAQAISGDTAAADNFETMLDGTGGNKLTLSQLKITASGSDDAIEVTGGSSGGNGIRALGVAGGSGLYLSGGGSGDGLRCQGGGSNGHGIQAAGGGGNGHGIKASAGNVSAHGIYAIGGGNGSGINGLGGAISGSGIRAQGNTGGDGFKAIGNGGGRGFVAQGGSTGAGASFIGGSTSGHGIECTATSGDKINADLSGSIGSLGTQAKADVNAEVDAALNTAIPGTPTPDSINERIKAVDDLLQSGGAGDAAAIKAKTDGLNFTGTDIKATLDGETVTVSINNDKTGYSLAADQSAVTVGQVNALGTQAKADVNAEVDTALADIHLDHLLATDTPAPLPGAAGSILNDLLEDDAGTWRYNANALEQSPTGGGGETQLRSGTAQGGGANTITLDAGASATDDYYKHCICALTGGTGAGQSQIIDSYAGATKVATMAGNWATAPDATTQFVLLPLGTIPGATAPTAAQVADAVWDEARADHKSAGSTGEALYRTHANAANKKQADASTGRTTVYDDDGITTLFEREVQQGATPEKVVYQPV